jgi:hypothetical protein
MVDDPSDAIDGRARTFLENVFATEADEIDCEALLAVVERYIEVEISGEDAAAFAGGVPAHLRQCAECAELYAALRLIVSLEEEGELPSLDSLWAELRARTAARVVEPSRAGRPSREPDARPERSSSRPSSALLPPPTTLPSARPWLALPGFSANRPSRLPAMLALTALVLGLGWWRTALAASEAESRLGRMHGLMETMADFDTMRTAEAPDGSWAKVFFSPQRSEALLYIRKFPRLDDGQRVTCWLKRTDAEPLQVGAWEDVGDDTEWWLIRGGDALAAYETLAVTIEPQGRPVLSVPLRASR